MKEHKIENGYTIYEAPEGKTFIHKERGVEVFGKAVVVHEEQKEYLIDDFKLVTDAKFKKLMEERKELVSNEG